MTFLHKLAKRLALVPVALAPLVLTVACGDGSQQDYLGPNPNKPAGSSFIGLSITPHDPQIVMGDSIRLSAQGWLSNGLSQPASVTWSASSGSVNASGWYRPATSGAFRVRAQVAGTSLSDSVLVTVTSPAGIARLDVTPGVAALSAGSKQQFTAVALMGNGTQVLPTVSWSADGGSISSTGLFTAGSEGSYSVTASLLGGSVVGRATGVVEPAELIQLSITPGAIQLESSMGRQFTAQASWTDGSSALPQLEWSATGGTISPSGAFVAGSIPGTYRVVVRSAQDERADTSIVTILPRIIGLRLAPVTALLALEATQVVTAYAQRSDGSESATAVQWSAEGGAISLGGAYTAGAVPGDYQVTGTLSLLSGEAFTAQALMQVAPDADEPTGGVQLQVLPDTTMSVGASNRFRVAVVGGGAVPAVIWSATGGSIDGSGLYTAGQSTGTYRVIAKKKAGNAKPDTASVTLVPAPVLSIASFTLSPQSDIIAQGQSRQFSATLNWNDGLPHPASISWVASGGTITSNGLYTAGSVAGTFLVIATCSCGAADTSSVSIPVSAAAPITLSRVFLTPASTSLAPGGSQQFAVSGVWSDGATSPPPVYYQAEGGSVNQAGLFLAGDVAGTYKVIATHTQSPAADTSFVTVSSASGPAQLTQLVLNPSAVTVPQGSTQPFVVSALWSDGGTAVPPVSFEATGGTVSPDGVYTAGTTAGTYQVIVRHSAGTKADTSVVTVPAPLSLTQLVLNPSTITLVSGGTQQFVVSGLWSDGSSTAPAVTWNVTGGTLSGSIYTAGATAGTFRVIALHGASGKADTSAVTISPAGAPVGSDTVALKLQRFDGGSGSVLVSSGIPLPQGRLTAATLGKVRILVNGVEQAMYVEALKGKHKDGSYRSVLVQFNATVGSTPVAAVLDFTTTRTVSGIAKTPVTWLVPAAAALPTSPAYLVSTAFMGPTVTATASQGMGFLFSTYESKFVTYSDYHWAQVGAAWEWNYYDRVFSHFAFWARTGNSLYWHRAAQIAPNYRGSYLEANNYGSTEYWAQLDGLMVHYWLTGDERSREAVYKTAESLNATRGSTARLTNTLNHPWMDSRVQARVLQAKLLSIQLEAPGYGGVSDWVAIARRDLNDILSTQAADGSYRFYATCGQSNNFMSGMLNEAYVLYYDVIEQDTRIAPAIKKNIDWLWATQWRTDQTFNYYSGYCANDGTNTSAPDISGFFFTGWGWYYRFSGNTIYRAQGEQILAGLMAKGWMEGGKQFNEAYRSSYRWTWYR